MPQRPPDAHPMSREPERWHPLLAAVEGPVGTWHMLDSLGQEYGVVRLVKRGPEVGYRADYTKRGDAELVGYYLTLRAACRAVHLIAVHDNGRSNRDGYRSSGGPTR